ncbi:MAG TPA: hypothetical protein VJB56_01060 [Candidatus Paceibacterota bacterium]
MLIGNLLTIVVSFVVAAVGIFSYIRWRGVHSRFKNSITHSFALFWLVMGFVWFFTALSNWWRYRGYIDAAVTLVYPLQIFLGVALVCAAYFVNVAIMGGRYKKFFLILYGVLLCAFLYTLFSSPLAIPQEAFFSGHIVSPLPTRIIFTLMFLPLWVSAVVFLYISFRKNTIAEKQMKQFLLLANLSLIILGGAGFFDELGIVNDWAVTLARIIVLMGALSGYGAILTLEDPEELVV